jgi:CysZ protein
MAGDFARGFTAPLRAVKLLARERRLRTLALLPLLVNVCLTLVGVPLVVWLVVKWIGGIGEGAGILAGALVVVLQVLAAAAIIVGAFFGFVIVGNIVAAPFNSKLSEAIEEMRTGHPVVVEAGIVVSAGRSIMTAIGRLAIFVVLYPPIFATSFIPVAGAVIYPVLSVLYGAFVLSLDFSDPTFERHLVKLSQKLGFIRARKALYAGFGGAAVLLTLIPFVNLLVLPVGVTAATLIYLEESERR